MALIITIVSTDDLKSVTAWSLELGDVLHVAELLESNEYQVDVHTQDGLQKVAHSQDIDMGCES